jgi:hypothetical protein
MAAKGKNVAVQSKRVDLGSMPAPTGIRERHAILGKLKVCSLEDITAKEAKGVKIDNVTCDDCLTVLVCATELQPHPLSGRDTVLPHISSVCAPDCQESCCVDETGILDMEALQEQGTPDSTLSIVEQALAQATSAPSAPSAPSVPNDSAKDTGNPIVRDILLYTSAPEECDLKRTETLDYEAITYQGKVLRSVHVHTEDCARQTRLYTSEQGCVVVDVAEWERYSAHEAGLSKDVTWLQDLCAQGADAILDALRKGLVKRYDPTAPPTSPQGSRRATTTPKATTPSSSPAKPKGIVYPEFYVEPGAPDMSAIPEAKKGMPVHHCICGSRWFGEAHDSGLCSAH